MSILPLYCGWNQCIGEKKLLTGELQNHNFPGFVQNSRSVRGLNQIY